MTGKKGVLLCLLLPMQAFAQAIGTWKVFPAYNVCSKNVPAGNRVYALMTSKLMAYDTDDTSIKAWDVTNGLSDMTITDIAYSEEAKCIVIVYDNGNIDLLSTDDDDYIVNLAQLKNSSLQGKEVNSISVYGQTAYLCTGFGLVVINLMDAVISSAYKLGMGVTACAVSDDAIYVGNSDGIWRGKRADNLQDKANWKHINSDIDVSMMSFFDGRVCVAVHGNFYISDAAGETYTSCEKFTPSYIHVEDGKMVVGNTANFSIYSDSSHRKYYNTGGTWADVHVKGNTLWVSEGTSGLQAYSIQEDKTFSLITASIQLNSPLYDYSYHLSFAGTRLLVAGGNYNYSSVSLPGAAMILEPDGTWVNFDPATATAFNKASRYIDVTDIAQDPDDATHHFVGTARSGLYEFRDAKCIGHYSCHNSPLKSILPSNSHAQWFVVADGNRFDSDGNLWMLNPAEGVSDTIIRILMHDGSWQGQQYDELSGVTAMDNILFDSRGWAWINSRRMEGRGIFCLDYNGTVSQRSDDRHILRSNIINQDGTTYTPDEFYCMAEDIDGTIWIGTNDGPFRIASPEDFFSSSFSYEQMKVARNDGSGLADYLLSSIPIRTIAIDGAGRKWFGTLSNGVYLISADCQEQIYHFTTDNSPIPSNDVENIAINGATGEVFFATTKGLCCFVSDATDPVDDISDNELFVFPNPVTPDYTGPIAVRGLTAGSEVKIVAPSGQIIYSGYSNGGTFTWNGTNQRGSRVASGVYLIIASKSDGSKAASSKVAIIR